MSILENGIPAVRANAPVEGTGLAKIKKFALKAHLWLALASGIFFLILGVTGAVIAFEQEIPRWLHAGLWYVQPGPQKLPETELVRNVEQRYAPARVSGIVISRSPRVAQVMLLVLPGRGIRAGQLRRAFVNPYTGAALGTLPLHTTSENILQTIHSIHLRIGMGDTGKLIVSIAGLILCFEVGFGLLLWLRLKRSKVKWSGSPFRIYFDLHHVAGIYALACLLLMGVTGVVIGFDDFFLGSLIYKITDSAPPPNQPPPQSPPVPGALPISVDRAMTVARQAMPGTTVTNIQLPGNPRASFNIRMRLPEETSPAVMSVVSVDQYTGQVLRVWSLRSSLGRRVIRFNRSIHTGDVWGLPGHVLVSLFSLALVFMVATGLMIWWRKLAI
ncbi:MAG TPA: PepSY-associated TM helix domain-containing protein [Candidatus Acidoferrales bacterium]|nr:PepSY-associated TM helix domain-containing protein [Candidatus Acidoferrales bacterium]